MQLYDATTLQYDRHTKRWYFEVPRVLCEIAGFHQRPTSEVYFVPKIGLKSKQGHRPLQLQETFHLYLNSRPAPKKYLYYLELSLEDRPGAFAEALTMLEDGKSNIIECHSIDLADESPSRLELICDLTPKSLKELGIPTPNKILVRDQKSSLIRVEHTDHEKKQISWSPRAARIAHSVYRGKDEDVFPSFPETSNLIPEINLRAEDHGARRADGHGADRLKICLPEELVKALEDRHLLLPEKDIHNSLSTRFDPETGFLTVIGRDPGETSTEFILSLKDEPGALREFTVPLGRCNVDLRLVQPGSRKQDGSTGQVVYRILGNTRDSKLDLICEEDEEDPLALERVIKEEIRAEIGRDFVSKINAKRGEERCRRPLRLEDCRGWLFELDHTSTECLSVSHGLDRPGWQTWSFQWTYPTRTAGLFVVIDAVISQIEDLEEDSRFKRLSEDQLRNLALLSVQTVQDRELFKVPISKPHPDRVRTFAAQHFSAFSDQLFAAHLLCRLEKFIEMARALLKGDETEVDPWLDDNWRVWEPLSRDVFIAAPAFIDKGGFFLARGESDSFEIAGKSEKIQKRLMGLKRLFAAYFETVLTEDSDEEPNVTPLARALDGLEGLIASATEPTASKSSNPATDNPSGLAEPNAPTRRPTPADTARAARTRSRHDRWLFLPLAYWSSRGRQLATRTG